uniref:Uncharacterized protein n=1 Tax=Thermogemmatispora argillosa TaxID=2045280 RepID=A0A455SY03_9CHLR|nr:hypothetical protein KTA_02500 [Thermogemmatispora argillosa]
MAVNEDALQLQLSRSEKGPAHGLAPRLEVEPSQVSPPTLSRRRLLSQGIKASVGVTALGTWLAACGGAPASTSGPVTIQFAALVDTTGEQTAEIKRFNDLHAGKIHINDPRLRPGACPQPRRPGLRGWLTAAHCPAGQYSDPECCVRH